ncbi:MAG: NAD(P)H-dependent oxidoreductase subunit E [Candidatus Cloacimonetes bacterium]|jgi:NADH-quinone oxidoreductase subunit E|nr:NAD(P)H-dependent oxidoreductase subunit E [Candidatus Cloacimonadota bacterium]MDY0337469.1 NAD(P)H-dependent oxidoreductase subunit E [Candidatus Cloacimonadaceae bacterium]MCK9335137.1 NAD(P)H-dependent oxidoreductase subunit E [Candidatus Cloacimonadota bacterium]MDD2543279.1 NAD(P)H-dependent oxidoreductase subunit E [Candidatus Cloacimonadota bacterium]MDD2684013.1 NAD(P)H-dependent oxidoreductase subunit E [Candidatus Cloacimonadota bacterium]
MSKQYSAAQSFNKVMQILDRFDRSETKIIPILQAVQEEYRYLPQEVLTFIATSLGVSPARLYGVATFYSHFSLEPKGKHILKMCDGTACHVRGSSAVIDAIRERLHLNAKKITTDDMMFTFETVSCLGACGLAPVLVVDDEIYGQVKPEQALAILDKIEAEERENA